MDPHRHRIGVAMAASAYIIWGLLAPVGKILLVDFAPTTLNALRALLGLVLLAVVLRPPAMRTGFGYLRDWRLVVLVFLGGGLNFTLYYLALERIDATYVALGFYTAPLWTAAVAWFWIRERVGQLFLPTVAAMLAGGFFALGGVAGGLDGIGLALAVGTGLLWAVYAVGLRVHAPALGLAPLLWASFVVWALYFVLVALVVDGLPDFGAVPISGWLWLALYIAGPTVGSMFLFNGALQRTAAGTVNLLVGLEVAFTVLFAWMLLGDTFTWVQVAGAGVVLVAVTLYLWQQGRAAAKADLAPDPT